MLCHNITALFSSFGFDAVFLFPEMRSPVFTEWLNLCSPFYISRLLNPLGFQHIYAIMQTLVLAETKAITNE